MPQDMSREPAMDPAARGTGLEGLVGLAALMTERRWCVWVWSSRRGSSWTKVPVIAGSHHHLRADDPTCARSYAACRGGVIRGEAAGVGWMCVGDLQRVWFDLDKCRDPVTGEMAPWARAFLARAGAAYWEVTPSGTGIRVMGRVAGFSVARQGRLMMREFLGGLDAEGLAVWGGSTECEARAAIEMFLGCVRYVTMSGWMAAGDGETDVTDLTRDVLTAEDAQDVVRAPRVRALARGQEAKSGEALTGPVEDIVGAFQVIPNAEWDENASWDEWSLLGMATWNATNGSPEGFEAWCGWSAKSELHIEENCLERWDRWRVSRVDAVGIGLIMMRAARWSGGSFRRPTRRPAAEFQVEAGEADADADAAGGGGGGGGEGGGSKGGGAFAELAARVRYIRSPRGWLDRDGTLLDDQQLVGEAGAMGVPGFAARGAKGLVPRLLRRGSGVRHCVGMTMRPGQGEVVMEARGLCANLWRPSDLVPVVGATEDDARPWLNHAEALIPDEADRGRVLDRLAWMLQNPGKKINSALVLRGPQGAGKDTLLLPFCDAIGEHNHEAVPGSKVGGAFNGYLRKQFILITEMPPAHKRDCYEDLKGWLVTPPASVSINMKGIEPFSIPNVVNTAITTNHFDAIAMAEDDRRLEVVGTAMAGGDTPKERTAYFSRIYKWLEGGGSAIVAGYLMRRDVSAFQPNAAPPMTEAKRIMTREGAHPAVTWAMALFDEGGPLVHRDVVTAAEITTRGQDGRWGAGPAIARHLVTNHVVQALRMLGWLNVGVQIVDGEGTPRPWCRPEKYVLISQLNASKLKELIARNRARSVTDFDLDEQGEQ